MLKQRLLIAASVAHMMPGTAYKLYGVGSNAVTGIGGGTGTSTSFFQIGSQSVWVSIGVEQAAAYYIKNDGTLWYTGTPAGSVLTPTTTPTQAGVAATWKQIACNYNCSVAIRRDGTLWSWGSNALAGTGQGTTSGTTSFATQIGSATNWVTVACCFYASFAINSSGELYTWGDNTSYATGQGINSGNTLSPTKVGTDTDWSILGQGAWYNGYVIKTNGTLWSWGNGQTYQQGSGTTSDNTVPTQVGVASSWIEATSCSDGSDSAGFGIQFSGGNYTLWSWGTNALGFTGQGTTSGNTTVPKQVGTDVNWKQVLGGTLGGAVAIKNNGAIYGWGPNVNGLTGQGTLAGNTLSPTQSGTSSQYIRGAGGVYTIVVLSSNSGPVPAYGLYGFGGNQTGNMGNGSTSALTTVSQIGTETSWLRAYASRGDLGNGTSDFTVSFLIKSDNTLWVAGSNNSGATGLGITTGNTTSYQKVDASTNWGKVCCCASDNSFTVAIKTDGTLWSWGSNNVAQLGNGGLTDHYTPVQIGTDTDWSDISCSGNGSAGDQFAMAVKSTGTLWGWGANKSGGNGQGVDLGVTLVPTQVGMAADWKSVSCGAGSGIAVAPTGASGFCLMVKTDGTLWGTGINANANIDGSFTAYTSPVQIGTDTDWSSAEAGGGVSLAIKTTGTLWSWGCDKGGTTGQNTAGNTLTMSPTQVGSSALWSMVSLCYSSANEVGAAMGLRTDGTLWSWGSNFQYNLGNGSTSPASFNVPTQVGSATNWRWVSAGGPDGTSTALFSLALSS